MDVRVVKRTYAFVCLLSRVLSFPPPLRARTCVLSNPTMILTLSHFMSAASATSDVIDRWLGLRVVRCERLHGDGEPLALPLMAGRWVPVSRPDDHDTHVVEGVYVEGCLLGSGERYHRPFEPKYL